jgi:aspartate aminotransferase
MAKVNLSLAAQMPNPMFRLAALVHGRDDVVHLEFGEPDFPTPPHIADAAIRSIRDERQGYGPGNGILALREAIADRVGRVNGITAAPDQIIASAGGTGGLMALLACFCAPGDEVLVPDPAWAGYDGMLAAVGARLVRYPLAPERGWQPDLDALESAITPRTTVLLVNSPSNPCGAVYPRETITRLLDIARRHDLWLLSDECYDEFVYEGEHVSPAALDDEGRVVTIGTCSKPYAMTGWRVGWVVAPASLARAVTIAVSAQINNLPLFTQRAALAALTGPQDCVREMAAAYRARRDTVASMLQERGLLEYVPAGAFYYLLPAVRVVPPESRPAFDGVAFAEALIAARKIAVAPGVAFGPAASGYMRVSLASTLESLRAGIEGLFDFASTYRVP